MKFWGFDIVEIGAYAGEAFIETFHYANEESTDSDSSDIESQEPWGCGQITPSVEEFVENQSELCKPLENVFGNLGSDMIKSAITEPKSEDSCVSIKVLGNLLPGNDRNLIETCAQVCFWSCCETIKKVSPIIADATLNLLS